MPVETIRIYTSRKDHFLIAPERSYNQDRSLGLRAGLRATGMAYHFFISYSTNDERKAREIRILLESLGANIWMAPDSISPGDAYTLAIPKAIRESAVLLLI